MTAVIIEISSRSAYSGWLDSWLPQHRGGILLLSTTIQPGIPGGTSAPELTALPRMPIT
jgi:hypothetical protein